MTPVEANPARRGPVITFWGAAQMVTGSMHLLEAGATKVLLDCGLFQGKRDEARKRNAQFPFPPRQIPCVIVSHAHLDLRAYRPTLIHKGFSVLIFCTVASRDLLAVMLADSAKI